MSSIDLPARTPLGAAYAPSHAAVRQGLRLWGRALPSLLLEVTLPAAAGAALATRGFEAARPQLGSAATALGVLGAAAGLALAVLATAALVTRTHTGRPVGNAWGVAVRRFLPWSVSWLCVTLLVCAGSLLFVVPGLIALCRLFWADEFALAYGCGPFAALARSWRETRGRGIHLVWLQIRAWLAHGLLLVPLALSFALALEWIQQLPSPALSSALMAFAGTLFLLLFYAGIRAIEVVDFYEDRARR